MCLQETKMEEVNQQVINNLWKECKVDWVHLLAVGTVGGILLMWDGDKMKCKEVVTVGSLFHAFLNGVAGEMIVLFQEYSLEVPGRRETVYGMSL